MGKRIHDEDKAFIDVLFSPLRKAWSFISGKFYDLKVNIKRRFPERKNRCERGQKKRSDFLLLAPRVTYSSVFNILRRGKLQLDIALVQGVPHIGRTSRIHLGGIEELQPIFRGLFYGT